MSRQVPNLMPLGDWWSGGEHFDSMYNDWGHSSKVSSHYFLHVQKSYFIFREIALLW